MIFIGDNIYPISVVKTDAMVEQVARSATTCTLIANENIPAANVSAQMGGHHDKLGAQAREAVLRASRRRLLVRLRHARRSTPATSRSRTCGSARADGTPQAYQRVRDGDYQHVTVPEPIEMQSWQAIDELNRAINGQPAEQLRAAGLCRDEGQHR